MRPGLLMPLLLLAGAVHAQQEPAIEPTAEPVAEPAAGADWRFSARHTALGYLTQQAAQEDGPYNTGNRLAAIPRQVADAEWREDWRLDAGECNAGLDLRLMARKALQADAGIDRATQHDAYVRTGSLACRMGDGFEARLGREVLQWGNATFRSPSNPFFVDTGKTHPIRELLGKDFVQLGWRSAAGWSVAAVRHVGDAQRDDGATEPFQASTALRIDQVDATQSLGAIVTQRDGGRLRLGGYVTRTVSEAWLWYADASLQRGGDARVAVADASAPAGWRFAPRPDDQRLRGAALLGAAYTLESGWSLTGEALLNNEGYDRSERAQARQAAQAADALLQSGTPQAPAGAAVLADALQPRLSVLGRRHLFVQALRTEWDNRADVALRWAHNLDDGSGSLSGSLTYVLGARTQLLCVASLNRGSSDAEFPRLLRHSVLLGLRLAL